MNKTSAVAIFCPSSLAVFETLPLLRWRPCCLRALQMPYWNLFQRYRPSCDDHGRLELLVCLFLGLVCLVCLVGTCFGRTWQYSGGMAQCFGPVTPLRISAPWSCSGCRATWWVEVLQRLGKEILSNMGLSENSAC